MTRDNLHFREMPSHQYHEQRLPKAFLRFFDARVLPRLSLTGYKLAGKVRLAQHIVNQLIKATLAGACVGDTRDTHLPGVALRVQVWDSLIQAGLAEKCLAEQAGMVTRYRATHQLLDLKRVWRLGMLETLYLERSSKLLVATPYSLVLLHTGKLCLYTGKLLPANMTKKPISLRKLVETNAWRGEDGLPDPTAIKKGLDWFGEIEDTIERINRVSSSHAWQAFPTDPETGKTRVCPINTCVRQIHVGRLFRAMRLYSWGELSGQNLSKEVRQTIKVDGEPVAELDYAGMAMQMLYDRKGGGAPKPDVYRPEKVLRKFYALENASDERKGVVRDFVKKATNICLNVRRRKSANSSVGKLLADHPDSKFLRNVVFNLEGINATRIVTRIIKAHPAVAKWFFREEGMELMTLDGRIMYHTLYKLADKEIPVLPIHDSIVCRVSDVNRVEQAMRKTYFEFLQQDPIIRRVY